MKKNILEAWDQFWFSQRPLLNAAVFRILLCGVLFYINLSRQFDLDTFFSETGILPRGLALGVIPEFYRPPFEWFFWSNWISASLAHSLLVVGLLLLTLGIGNRLLTALVWVLQISFLHRNYSIAFGADLVGSIFLFYMIGIRVFDRLSVLNFFRAEPPSPQGGKHDLLHSVAYRMVQIQLCLIYAYTGFEKLKGGSWWDGTAVWSVFANSQMVVADFSFVRYVPLLIVFITFSTIAFEIYFPVLVWNRRLRDFFLIFGIVFHLGIGIVMVLMNFALIMLSPYVLFIESEKVKKVIRRYHLDELRKQIRGFS